MKKSTYYFYACLLLLTSPTLWACLDEQALKTLADQEMRYMLQRIPPAFADAVADKQIQGKMTLQASDPCQAHWQLSLPRADIAEAQALLQAEPAKQIMLAAQGYLLPEQADMAVDFAVDQATLQPAHHAVLQTAPLGQLRASVELMYAMLTQSRADGSIAVQPWTETDAQSINTHCQQQFRADPIGMACDCYQHGLAEKYSARQVRYNQYLSTNPYAFATGNGAAFKRLDKSLQVSCGLTATR